MALRVWLEKIFGGTSDQERRKFERRPFNGSVSVRTQSGQEYRGVGRDISDAGVGAIVSGDLTVGQIVIVRYRDGDTITHAKAVVKQQYGYRYGFEIVERLPLPAE
ncbi:MAG TPA: PilZ domain-containing protein [Terriglobales bacterium]|nr:PilZ domain-containing protein [Terriglobales bacterium]